MFRVRVMCSVRAMVLGMAYGIGLLFWLWSRDMAVHRVMAMA